MKSPKSKGFKIGNLSEPYKLTELSECFESPEIRGNLYLSEGFDSRANSQTFLHKDYYGLYKDYIRHCNNEKPKKVYKSS